VHGEDHRPEAADRPLTGGKDKVIGIGDEAVKVPLCALKHCLEVHEHAAGEQHPQ
jgi:hypothetical protein